MIIPPDLGKACAHFNGFPEPWFVAGGWAIDLFLGRVTREHSDIDFCVFRDSLGMLLAHFSAWERIVCIPGGRGRKPCVSKSDAESPRHELHFTLGSEKLEILLVDRRGDSIVFRRDPSISLPFSRFSQRCSAGIPHVDAAWQMLFKAKEGKQKDDADFMAVLPVLSRWQRAWLIDALRHHQPDIWWVSALSGDIRETGNSIC